MSSSSPDATHFLVNSTFINIYLTEQFNCKPSYSHAVNLERHFLQC